VTKTTRRFCTVACSIVLLAATGACAGDDRPSAGEVASVAPRPAPGEPAQRRRATAALARLQHGWSSLPAPPSRLPGAVSLWTGRALLAWSGEPAGGALYDPVANRWRLLPPGPLARRRAPAAAWTGREVLIWGGDRDRPLGDGAKLDPARGTWTRMAASPLSPRAPAASVWTGRELIVWGDASRATAARDGAAYDAAADRWRRLPPAPLTLNLGSATWTGTEMVVFGALLDRGNRSTTRRARGAAYDPAANRWRRLAPSPLSPQASSIAWTGREVLAWDYELDAAAYDPARDRWRRLGDLPLRFSECYPASTRTGRSILAWYCGAGALYDIDSSGWRQIRRVPRTVAGAPVAAGPVVLFLGARDDSAAARLWAYRPAPQPQRSLRRSRAARSPAGIGRPNRNP
jgi:hypothetical protein